MKTFIVALFFSIALCLTCQVVSVAWGQDKIGGEHIKSFDWNTIINKDGTIDVKETIVYDFGDRERHGIFRKIPIIKTNKERKKFRLDFSNFSITDENTTMYRYTVVMNSEGLTLKIGDADKTVAGVHTYIISYTVSGALTYFSDHDELYWNVTGNKWDVPIEKYTSEVYFADNIAPNDIKASCFTGSGGSNESDCESSVENKIVIFKSINKLSAYHGFTLVVSFPKNHVAVLEPKPVILFFDTIVGKIAIFIFFVLATFWYILYPFKIIYKWHKHGRDPKGTVGETTAWFDPPKTPLGKRFLTPAEVGTLGDETVDLKDISATIIDLARRGYLRIEERKKKDFYFVSTKPTSSRLSRDSAGEGRLLPFEKKLLDGLFKDDDEIRIKDEKLYETVEDVKKSLYEDVVNERLFPKNPQSIRTFYSAIAGIALFTLNFFLAAVAFVFGRNMPRKTVEGVNAFNVAKSLKNFLTSQERQLTFQADKQTMFEKLLPFAVAFGVEKIWAKRFETMNLREPDWYQGYGQSQFNSVIFASSMSSSFSSFRSAATPTSSSSGFSSGFSGGSSGGGGGGGGGGSW